MLCHVLGMLKNQLTMFFLQVQRRINCDRVTGVNTGTLHVLHDAGDQHILAIKHAVHFQLTAHQVLVNQNGVLLNGHVDDLHELFNVAVIIGNFHTLTAKHVRRTHQNGVAQLIGSLQRFFRGKDCTALGSRNIAKLQNLIKTLTVFSGVHTIGRSTKDLNTHISQCLSQLNGSLTAELNNCAPRFLQLHDVLNVLGSQRLKVELIRHVKVGGNGFRVIVNNDGLKTHAAECPHRMNRAIVKLNALANTNGAGAENQDFFLARAGIHCLIFSVIRGVIVRCFCIKFSGASIHLLEGRNNAVAFTQRLNFRLFHAAQMGNVTISKAHFLGFLHGVCIRHTFACHQFVFHVDNTLEGIQEPNIHLGDVIDLLRRETAAKSLSNDKQTLVGNLYQHILNLVGIQILQFIQLQSTHIQLQRADSLHQCTLEGVGNSHNLTRGLHLGAQIAAGGGELVKRQAGNLQHHIVDSGLKARLGGAGNCVINLIKGIAQSHLSCHLGDGITGSLGSQRGRTGNTGIDLDDRILVRIGIQCKLNVTATLYFQRIDNVQCGRA